VYNPKRIAPTNQIPQLISRKNLINQSKHLFRYPVKISTANQNRAFRILINLKLKTKSMRVFQQTPVADFT